MNVSHLKSNSVIVDSNSQKGMKGDCSENVGVFKTPVMLYKHVFVLIPGWDMALLQSVVSS